MNNLWLRYKLRALSRRLFSVMGGFFVSILLSLPFAQATGADTDQIGISVRVSVGDIGPPSAISNLTALPGIPEGTVRLAWTAPGDNGMEGTAEGYVIKLATYPITRALFDLAPTYTPVPNWTPRSGGSAEGLSGDRIAGGLEPGVTYYFAIKAFDFFNQRGEWNSSLDVPGVNSANFAQATDLSPPAPTGLTATGGNQQIVLSWNAVPVSDLDYYRIERDTSSPPDVFVALTTTTATTFTNTGLASAATYFYRVIAVDRGAPAYPGLALESAASAVVSATTLTPSDSLAPDAPMGLKGNLDPTGKAFTLIWEPVQQNADGSPITDLAGYNVYRRTTLTNSPTRLNPLPITTTVFADQVDGQTYYYTIRATDQSGNESLESLTADSSPLANVIYVAPDRLSTVFMPQSVNDLLRSAHNKYGVPLTIGLSEEPVPANTAIVRSIRLQLLRGDTKQALSDLAFAQPQTVIAIAYNMVNGEVAPGAPFSQNVSALSSHATPDQLSLYWNNGVTWIKIGGTLDLTSQVIKTKSSFLGNYQLRVSARATSLTLEQTNVYPRVFTPNSDGFNDRVYFVLENPNNVSIKGEIFDTAGRHVVTLAPPVLNNGIGTTLIWDGKDASGTVVPSGVYLYRIEGEGKTFTGSVAVAR